MNWYWRGRKWLLSIILHRQFPGRTGQNHENPQSGSSVCRMRFELGTSNQVPGVEFEILSKVHYENTISRDVKPCIQIEVYRRFGGKYCIHSEARRESLACNQCPFSGLALVSLHLVPVGFRWITLKVYTWTTISKCGSFYLVIICLTYSSILKMKAVHSSEMSVNFYLTTRCHIPEDRTLHFTRDFTTKLNMNAICPPS
jgi:hypothetical protein